MLNLIELFSGRPIPHAPPEHAVRRHRMNDTPPPGDLSSSMSSAERTAAVLGMLDDGGTITIKDVADELGISEESARNRLLNMADKGLVRKVRDARGHHQALWGRA